MAAHEPRVRDWLLGLGAVTTSNFGAPEMQLRVNAMARLLAEKLPAEAFTDASYKACAATISFFPSYAELLAVLEPWWQENQPVATVPFDPHGLTEEDRALVGNFIRHAANDWGKTIPLRTDRALYRELDRYRHLRERVFQYLIAHNDAASSMAKRNGWSQPKRAAATPIQPEVRRSPPLTDEDDYPDA